MKGMSQFGLVLLALFIGITTAAAQQNTGTTSMPGSGADDQALPTNLIINGGFEDTTSTGSFEHWSVYNDASGTATITPDTVSAEVFSGKVSLKIVNPTSSSDQWNIQLASDTFNIQAGHGYRVSLWIKSKNDNGSGRISTKPDSIAHYQGDFSTSTSWQHITWIYPGDATISGARIALDMGQTANTYYIDNVSVVDTAEIGSVSAPTNLMVASHGKTNATLVWTAPSGSTPSKYMVYRSTQTNAMVNDMMWVDSSATNNYTDNDLNSKTTYYYKVTSVDSQGMESDPSDEVSVKTDAFASYMTEDFENGVGNWVKGDNDNMTFSTVDSMAFSGKQSVALVPTGTGNLDCQLNNPTILPGQLLRFHVYVADTTGIAGIQPFFQYTNWSTWQSRWYNPSDLKQGSWNLLEIRLADSVKTTVLRAGIQVAAKSGASIASPLLVDFITTDPNATILSTPIDKGPVDIPHKLTLNDNYPNPFNPTTNISYNLPKGGFVTLSVYDVLGRRVAMLIQRRETAGSHIVTFNASQLASGVYFYRLQANNRVMVKKMLLLK